MTDNTFFVFSLQAKLLFSDGEKVIPRLTHELPGIKVRVPVCRCFAGRTNQTGRLESSVAPRRLHGPLFVGPSLNSIVPRGLLSPGSGVPEGVFQGFCLLRPRGPVAPGQWPPPDSLPFPTPSVAGRQKRSVPSEEAPFPKR